MADTQIVPGDRIVIHASTDAWMRGDRFGYVVKIGRKYVHVLMDRSVLVRQLIPANVTVIAEGWPQCDAYDLPNGPKHAVKCLETADRIAVMRDGRTRRKFAACETHRERLAHAHAVHVF